MNTHLKKYLSGQTLQSKSVLWMLASCFCSSVMAVITKYVSATMPPLEMVFFRNMFAVLFLMPWALSRGIPHIKAANFRLYFSRAASSLFAMSMFFYAISIIPLTNAIALTFTVPLITTLFAIIFLGEKVQAYRWIAILVGFIGVLIILRPGHSSFQMASLIVIASTIGWATSNILIKKLSHTDHPRAMVFILMLIMTPLTFPGALFVWQPPQMHDVLWMVALGIATNEAQFCMNKAYKHAEMSAVMPFDFSRLIFTSALAYIFFAEVIDIWTFIGSVVIFCSSIYVVTRESRERKRKAKSFEITAT